MGRARQQLASPLWASVGLPLDAALLGVVFTLLATNAVSAAARSASSVPGLSAAKPGPILAPRFLPDWDSRHPAARTGPAPAAAPGGGLLLDRGVFRPLPDVPGAAQTVHFRNNNRGEVAGIYADLSNGTARLRGFLIKKGRVTRIDVPGAQSTLPVGINDRGQVVGGWVGPDATVDPVDGETKPVHGFLWEGGRFKKFDISGAATTAPYEINNRGRIVGNYGDAAGAEHRFVLHGGVVTTIDHPGATASPALTGTRVVGIDDRGRLVGSFGDDAGTIRAWKRDDGRFTTIHPRGALLSEAREIDNRGRIVGRYVDATPKLRSFLLYRGQLRRIDAPNRCDTSALGLNDHGQIVIAAPGTTDGTTCPPQKSAG